MTETFQWRVTGMTCGGCENAVKRTLLQMDGIEDVSASHSESVVGVTYDSEKVTPARIKQQIETLGYNVAP